VPALQPYLIGPILWQQFEALLPKREANNPLGCHPEAHPRQGGLRETGAGLGVRLRLLEDRRGGMFGYDAQAPTRRVDGSEGDSFAGG
jgi:hypothetical protein